MDPHVINANQTKLKSVYGEAEEGWGCSQKIIGGKAVNSSCGLWWTMTVIDKNEKMLSDGKAYNNLQDTR